MTLSEICEIALNLVSCRQFGPGLLLCKVADELGCLSWNFISSCWGRQDSAAGVARTVVFLQVAITFPGIRSGIVLGIPAATKNEGPSCRRLTPSGGGQKLTASRIDSQGPKNRPALPSDYRTCRTTRLFSRRPTSARPSRTVSS